MAFLFWVCKVDLEIILSHGSPTGLIYFGLKEATCLMCLSSSHRLFFFFSSRATGQVLSLELERFSEMRWSQLCQARPDLLSEPFPNTSDPLLVKINWYQCKKFIRRWQPGSSWKYGENIILQNWQFIHHASDSWDRSRHCHIQSAEDTSSWISLWQETMK